MASRRFTEVEEVYNAKLASFRNPIEWENTLKAVSNFWKVSFCEAMLISAQMPRATYCASYDVWNKVGRYVSRGQRSIAIFKSRTDTELNYVFDISQTRGRYLAPKWKMTDRIANAILEMQAKTEQEYFNTFAEYLQKSLDKRLVSMYNYIKEQINVPETDIQRIADIAAESARCMVYERCGVNSTYRFADVQSLAANPAFIMEIANLSMTTAQSVLREIDEIVRRKEYEKYQNVERRGYLRNSERSAEQRNNAAEIHQLRQSTDVPVGEKSTAADGGNQRNLPRPDKYEWSVSQDMGGDSGEIGNGGTADTGNPDEQTAADGQLHREVQPDRTGGNTGEGGTLGTASDNDEVVGGSLLGETEPERNQGDTDSGYDSITETEYNDEADFDEESASLFDEEDSEELQLSLFGDTPKRNSPTP